MNHTFETKNSGTLDRRAKIFIVDDHELVRDGLRHLIENQPDLQICGEAANMNDAKQKILQTAPNVALVDLKLGETDNGLELIKWLVQNRPEIKIIACTIHSESGYGERVLKLGGMGFVNKQESNGSIISAIRKVLAGRLFFSEFLTCQVLRRSTPHAMDCTESPVAKLSNRELEILALLGQGYTSEMIAQRLFLSRNTIGTYRERLKTKLNLKNYSELLFFAIHWADGSERKIVQQDATQAVQP